MIINEIFASIPGYSNYIVTCTGRVLNIKKNKWLKGGINPNGYFLFRLTADDGTTLTWGRHRLMCFVFKNPGCDIDELYVNHINGIKGDDWLGNLEWVTPSENVEHAGAHGLTSKCLPISARNVNTGIVLKFNSLIKCANHFNVSKDAIVWRVKSGEDMLFPEGYQYRVGHRDHTWALATEKTSKRIVVKELKTGRILKFQQLQEAAVFFGVSPATMTAWSNKPNQPLLPGYIQLKWETDSTPWRLVKDPIYELSLSMGTKAVSVKNTVTGMVWNYVSGIECAKARNINLTTLNNRLKNNLTVEGFYYSYYCPTTPVMDSCTFFN